MDALAWGADAERRGVRSRSESNLRESEEHRTPRRDGSKRRSISDDATVWPGLEANSVAARPPGPKPEGSPLRAALPPVQGMPEADGPGLRPGNQGILPLHKLAAPAIHRLHGNTPLCYGDRGVRRASEPKHLRRSSDAEEEEGGAASRLGPLRLPDRPAENLGLDVRGFAGFPVLEEPSGGVGPGGLPPGTGKRSILRVLEEALLPPRHDGDTQAAGHDPRPGFAGLPLGGGREVAMSAIRPLGHLAGVGALPSGVHQGFMDVYRIGRGAGFADGVKDQPMARLVAREGHRR